MRKLITVFRNVVCAVCLLPALLQAQQPLDSVLTELNVLVPMRDGVHLATDIYRPAPAAGHNAGTYPAILIRTPYNKSNLGDGFIRPLVQSGYVVVNQDCRGRFQSEGFFKPFTQEGADGFDAIEWTAAQPWCNGRIGTWGGSYLAWDQTAAALLQPPHLTAMFQQVGGSNFYADYGYPGGVPNQNWPWWMFSQAASAAQFRGDDAAAKRLRSLPLDITNWFPGLPSQLLTPLQPWAPYHAVYSEYIENTEFNKYWRTPGWYFEDGYDRMKDVPTYYVSGWYDYFRNGTTKNFVELRRRQSTPKKLLMGPWLHGVGRQPIGDAYFNTIDGNIVAQEMRRWFDYWLLNKQTGILEAPPIRYFVMGGGSGRKIEDGKLDVGGVLRVEHDWPPRAVATPYYLQPGDGLSTAAPPASQPSTYLYDPLNPTPSIGGMHSGHGAGLLRAGIQDQRFDQRTDIVTCMTEPLNADVEVTGRVAAKLWISSDAPDTDIMVQLVDVYPPNDDYPDGFAANITMGQLRMRYRASFEHPALMAPGEIYEITVDLWETSLRFKRGHRIRVDISSSSFPNFLPNPNTGEPVHKHTEYRKAKNSIYHDPAHPSHILMPVVE